MVLEFFKKAFAGSAFMSGSTSPVRIRSVSYTHLDVYKRQGKALKGLAVGSLALAISGAAMIPASFAAPNTANQTATPSASAPSTASLSRVVDTSASVAQITQGLPGQYQVAYSLSLIHIYGLREFLTEGTTLTVRHGYVRNDSFETLRSWPLTPEFDGDADSFSGSDQFPIELMQGEGCLLYTSMMVNA